MPEVNDIYLLALNDPLGVEGIDKLREDLRAQVERVDLRVQRLSEQELNPGPWDDRILIRNAVRALCQDLVRNRGRELTYLGLLSRPDRPHLVTEFIDAGGNHSVMKTYGRDRWYEPRALATWNGNHLPAPFVRSNSGRYSIGEYVCTHFEMDYIEGSPPNILNDEQLDKLTARVAHILQKVHTIPVPNNWTKTLSEGVYPHYELIVPVLLRNPKWAALVGDDWQKRTDLALDLSKHEPYAILHGNLARSHILEPKNTPENRMNDYLNEWQTTDAFGSNDLQPIITRACGYVGHPLFDAARWIARECPPNLRRMQSVMDTWCAHNSTAAELRNRDGGSKWNQLLAAECLGQAGVIQLVAIEENRATTQTEQRQTTQLLEARHALLDLSTKPRFGREQ